MKINTDKYKRYNIRAKVDFAINKYAQFENNISFYGSTYNWVGYGAVDNNFAMLGRHLYSFFLDQPRRQLRYPYPGNRRFLLCRQRPPHHHEGRQRPQR